MIEFIEQQARTRGATALALDTAHLRQWYERLGFRFIEFVSWHDTDYRSVILSKPLTTTAHASAAS